MELEKKVKLLQMVLSAKDLYAAMALSLEMCLLQPADSRLMS